MIIYQSSSTWRRLAIPSALALAFGTAAYMWLAPTQDAGRAANGPAGRASEATAAASGFAALPFGLGSTQGMAEDGGPMDISPDDWKALKAALSKQANGEAEAERIVTYLRYQHDFEFWQSNMDSKNVEKRNQMARALLNQLPERVAKGDFTGGEGVLMGAILLGDLEEDESKREKLIDDWTQRLNATAPQPSDEKLLTDKDRQTELKRRQANAYAEWQTKPASERDQAQLNKAMDEAQSWYRSGTP
jgi:hypothetical protein